MSENFDVGERIKQLRANFFLSQEQLALLADVTPAYLGCVERNESNPSVRTIEKICHALNITLETFFNEEKSLPDNSDISTQIAFHLKNKSDAEKKAYLQLIRQVCKIQDM